MAVGVASGYNWASSLGTTILNHSRQSALGPTEDAGTTYLAIARPQSVSVGPGGDEGRRPTATDS
jgi:hypothetical protein